MLQIVVRETVFISHSLVSTRRDVLAVRPWAVSEPLGAFLIFGNGLKCHNDRDQNHP